MDGIVQKIWPLLDNPKYRFKAAETLIAISQHRCKILDIFEGDKVYALANRMDAEIERLTREVAEMDELENTAIELD